MDHEIEGQHPGYPDRGGNQPRDPYGTLAVEQITVLVSVAGSAILTWVQVISWGRGTIAVQMKDGLRRWRLGRVVGTLAYTLPTKGCV